MARGYTYWKSKLAIATLGSLFGLLVVLMGFTIPFMTEAPPRGMKQVPHDPHRGQALAFVAVGVGIGLVSSRLLLRSWKDGKEGR